MQLPSFIARMIGFADKAESHFNAETKLAEALTRISTLEAEISSLKAAAEEHAGQVTDLTTRLTAAQAESTAQAVAITTIEASLETEKRRTVETLAAQGLSPDSLPASSPNGQVTGAAVDPITKLRAELEAATDPQQKYTLSVQIRELLGKRK